MQYLWDFGDGQTDTSFAPRHKYTNAGVYDAQLIVINNAGCADTLLINKAVRVYDTLQATFTLADSMGCQPFSIAPQNFSTRTDSIATYTWSFGDGQTDNSISPSHTYTASGNFTLQLIITDRKGCADTSKKNIIVYPKPIAKFGINGSLDSCTEKTVQFTDQSTGADTIYWDFGDGQNSTNNNPAHSYENSGTYAVTQQVSNQYGCTDTITSNLCVFASSTLLIPNVFTPNGDNLYDKLYIRDFGIATYHLQIFNRWGQKVFDTKRVDDYWDGTYLGASSTEGTYIYIAEGMGVDNKDYYYIGQVQLIR